DVPIEEEISEDIIAHVYSGVWTMEKPGRAKSLSPVEPAKRYLPLNGKILKVDKELNSPGLFCLKISPTIFGNQLAKDLKSWETPPGKGRLLQYVDNILIATETEDACMAWTGITLGILVQDLGPYRRAVDYISKQLDATAKGWPGCLCAVAAMVLNIQEARKFTLGQKMTVLVSHTVSAVLEVKSEPWLSPQRFLKYQAIMVEQDDVEIVVTNIVNPASFLSGNTGEPVHHDCLETVEATYSSHLDLKDAPIEDAENWFMDRSSYVLNGRRHAGYAITTWHGVI
ncbi:hypothetical protein HGM15179_021191, partial [Zosterops borbonicus]